jgi:SAM-dependent methyltransferase
VRFDDPDVVRREYATEEGLAARAALYLSNERDGPDARDTVVEAVRVTAPRRLLEVGCGWGELAERMGRELGAEVVALDLSPRMVELARERGVDARVGDVQELAFADGAFDTAVAAWVLHHVPELDRGLAELARVLRPGGTLVAATNAGDDPEELWELVGRDLTLRLGTFGAENGEASLARHFASVQRHDLVRPVTFPDSESLRRYVGSSVLGRRHLDRVPELSRPFVATKRVAVFVAENPA